MSAIARPRPTQIHKIVTRTKTVENRPVRLGRSLRLDDVGDKAPPRGCSSSGRAPTPPDPGLALISVTERFSGLSWIAERHASLAARSVEYQGEPLIKDGIRSE